jgi:hypothetical protein
MGSELRTPPETPREGHRVNLNAGVVGCRRRVLLFQNSHKGCERTLMSGGGSKPGERRRFHRDFQIDGGPVPASSPNFLLAESITH